MRGNAIVPFTGWIFPELAIAFKLPSDKVIPLLLERGFQVQKLFSGLSGNTSYASKLVAVKCLLLPLVSAPIPFASAPLPVLRNCNLKPLAP